MLSRRKTYAGRIKHPDDATEPATLDPLGAIAPLFRARPEIQDVCRFALQWEVVHEAQPPGFAQFHIVTNGNCLLERYSGETFKLEAGSILLLPQGDFHDGRTQRETDSTAVIKGGKAARLAASFMCAEYERRLGGGSPLSSLMTAKD